MVLQDLMKISHQVKSSVDFKYDARKEVQNPSTQTTLEQFVEKYAAAQADGTIIWMISFIGSARLLGNAKPTLCLNEG